MSRGFGCCRPYEEPVPQGADGRDAARGAHGATPKCRGISRLGESGLGAQAQEAAAQTGTEDRRRPLRRLRGRWQGLPNPSRRRGQSVRAWRRADGREPSQGGQGGVVCRLKRWSSTHAADDAGDSAGTGGEIDMLDAEGGSGDDYVPDLPSDSDEDDDAPHCPSCGAKDDEGKDCSTHQDERAGPESVGASKDQGEPRPLRSKRRPAPKVTLWTMDPKAYLAIGTDASAKDGWDLTKPPANAKEAPARSDWLL